MSKDRRAPPVRVVAITTQLPKAYWSSKRGAEHGETESIVGPMPLPVGLWTPAPQMQAIHSLRHPCNYINKRLEGRSHLLPTLLSYDMTLCHVASPLVFVLRVFSTFEAEPFVLERYSVYFQRKGGRLFERSRNKESARHKDLGENRRKVPVAKSGRKRYKKRHDINRKLFMHYQVSLF